MKGREKVRGRGKKEGGWKRTRERKKGKERKGRGVKNSGAKEILLDSERYTKGI